MSSKNCFSFDNDCHLGYQLDNEVGSVLEAESNGNIITLKLKAKSGRVLSQIQFKNNGMCDEIIYDGGEEI